MLGRKQMINLKTLATGAAALALMASSAMAEKVTAVEMKNC